jgi:hypothetical protein
MRSSLELKFEQLWHCCSEPGKARAAHEAMAAKMKAEFDAEVAALRCKLAEAHAMLDRLQMLNEFARYQRRETRHGELKFLV